MKALLKGGVAAAIFAFSVLAAVAAPPPYLADLMNQSEAWTKDQMTMRGYSVTRSQYNDVYWSNRNTRSCVVITISQGKVIEISELAHERCEGDGVATNLPSSPGMGASPQNMVTACRDRVNKLLRADSRYITATYEGPRQDGTNSVNGCARIAGQRVQFQCNFASNGYLSQIVVLQ